MNLEEFMKILLWISLFVIAAVGIRVLFKKLGVM